MYGEHIYLLDRMWSVCVMSKTDSMLNVIHSNVKRERERERKTEVYSKGFPDGSLVLFVWRGKINSCCSML